MPLDMSSYLENRKTYLENRAKFPLEELTKYAGQWIAWNPTSTRVVASASDPEDLEDLVRRAGQDPGLCVIEGIPDSDSVLGGGSLNLEQV